MPKVVSAAHAKSHLSALMDEVARGGEHVIIERRGKPHVAMVRVTELPRLEESGRNEPLGGLGLLGAWGAVEDEEIDAMLDLIYAERQRHRGRAVELEV